MSNVPLSTVRNSKILRINSRPLEHYLLSILSMLLNGDKEIIIESQGSLNGRSIDLVNLITHRILPGKFNSSFENRIDRVKVGSSEYDISILRVMLKVRDV